MDKGYVFFGTFSIIVSAVVVFLSVYFAHFLSIRRQKISNFNNASKEFSETIHKELKNVYPHPVNWPTDIDEYLRSKHATIQSVVNKFKRYLPVEQREAFDRAWVAFYNAHSDDREQCYHHYIGYNNNPKFQDNLKNNVGKLLSFAKEI